MASPEDEEVPVPHSVTNYYFEDEDSEPVSFSVLPVWFVGKKKPNALDNRVFLRGADDFNQKIYKEVVAYRFGLEDATPEIKVLSKERKKWIKLLRPRKVYESTFRSIFVTIHLLHYLRKNTASSRKGLWAHLREVFGSFVQFPSANDLLNHRPLIEMLVESDNKLAKCKFLLSLLEDKPKVKTFLEDHKKGQEPKKSSIVVDDDEDVKGSGTGDESDDEIELYDSVCALCDNGGELLCCEGRCMRSFHATTEDAKNFECRSLGYSKAQIKTIEHFICKNCEYKRHQCYICGKLGSSDKSAGTEVFVCVNATCGYFYHPKCVSDWVFPHDAKQAADYENKVANGEPFICPAHKCHVCKQGENKEIKTLQFAVCKRCPRSYHRKCLPRKITFEDEGFTIRAWEGLLPDRILIYCLKHEIPIRNLVVFPRMEMKDNFVEKKKNKSEVWIKKTNTISNEPYKRSTCQIASKQEESFSKSIEKGDFAIKCSETSIEKPKLNLQKQSNSTKVNADFKSCTFDALESKKFAEGNSVNNAASESDGKLIMSSYPKIDSEGVERTASLVESTSNSITLADINKKHKMPSTHRETSRNLDKYITGGKLEGSVKAVKTALANLEDGENIEDAKAVCEPNIINLIMLWHIVDKLQCYVQNDDMIVDFCCGGNDFSRLMKEKLDSMGKKCHYKNYDIIQSKFDFNFEKQDWMTVRPDELPSGSRLIICLYPPFGVKGALANQFIDKALSFKPKLIILIAPSEIERLDQKRPPYDLIWEDSQSLSGKPVYLPGSVDANHMQMEQWNNKPPSLYLWSHPDWTTKHKTIGLEHGHIFEIKNEFTCNKSQPVIVDDDSDHTSEKNEADEVPFTQETVNKNTSGIDDKRTASGSQKRSRSSELFNPDEGEHKKMDMEDQNGTLAIDSKTKVTSPVRRATCSNVDGNFGNNSMAMENDDAPVPFKAESVAPGTSNGSDPHGFVLGNNDVGFNSYNSAPSTQHVEPYSYGFVPDPNNVRSLWDSYAPGPNLEYRRYNNSGGWFD